MKQVVDISPDLIRKYAVPLARYKSYPEPSEFHAEFDAKQFSEQVVRSNAGLLPKNLSLYVHIPFCHSLCYLCGCTEVVAQTNSNKVNDYLNHLHQEISLHGQFLNDDHLVTQIHFGGCMPNFLHLDQIADILNQIATQFHLELPNNLQVSIKLNPKASTQGQVEELAKLGFNRFNIKVEDFCRDTQTAFNREQDETATLALINAAMKTTASVSVELIISLPKQTIDSFADTLNKTISTGGERISEYVLIYPPQHFKEQNFNKESRLSLANQRCELWQVARTHLLAAAYQHIGMDHYALATHLLAGAQANNTLQRNFQGYTAHKATDVIGIGVGAISEFDTAFAQNQHNLSLYNELIDIHSIPISRGLTLTEDDRIRAAVMQQIMCRSTVDLNHSISRYTNQGSNIDLLTYFARELAWLNRFKTDGLIKRSSDGFRLTEVGRYFMRPIAANFDGYLNPCNGIEDHRKVLFSYPKT